MGKFIVIISVFFFACSTNIIAQNMSDYKRKNRLLIIMADDTKQSDYLHQLNELRKNNPGLIERKLIVFTATVNEYREGINLNIYWQKSKSIYQTYKKSNSSFEVILIGLDGGIKARKTEVFEIEDLFALIDGMPMRQSEIKNR